MKMKRPYRKFVYRKKVNILLVEIINRNLGDTVIADNAAYLVHKTCPYLVGRHCNIQHYDIASEDYELVSASDLIIFAGGGIIKYRQEQFYEHMVSIIHCAQENNIPVYLNCVGVEGYDEEDERCQSLKKALNSDCVKAVTVRDDYELFRHCYIQRKGVEVSEAVDPAIYSPNVYGLKRCKDSHTIGLGIARWRIFEDYGIPEVDRQYQLDMWKGVIQQLEERGYQWKLFVNGLRSDYDFALEVLAYAGYGQQEHLVQRPVYSRELVEAIAGFEAVIACRMHANIIAYALGIPSIGLVWNEKMTFWGRRIGHEDRFLTQESFVPELIVGRMEQSIRQGVHPVSLRMRRMIEEPLKRFLCCYVPRAWEQRRNTVIEKRYPWERQLVATALGGLEQRYLNMNTLLGLDQSIRQGFLMFEADLRLTTDGRLVCVNGWSKGTYEKLGMNPEELDHRGIDYETFSSARMYDGHFRTMNAQELAEHFSSQEAFSWKLILDIGKPDKETLELMIHQIEEICAQLENACQRVFLRLQSHYDVERVRERELPVEIMYFIPPGEKREEKKLSLESIGKYCKKQDIKWVSMPREALNEEVMAFTKKAKLQTCVFSLDTYTDIQHAAAIGVDWIATSYWSVERMNAMYERKTTLVIR